MPPPQARKQVDGGDEEGEEGGDQDELDRPAPDHADAEVDEARSAADELRALVERAQKLLRAAPDLGESCAVDPCGRVGEGLGAAITRRRQRHGSDSACKNGSLLVQRQRKGEVEQLPEAARPAGSCSGLFLDARRCGLDQPCRCLASRVACDLESRRCAPRDRVEHDRRQDASAIVARETARAETAEFAAVGCDEEERVAGSHGARACGRVS
jgi:hypothetical protein